MPNRLAIVTVCLLLSGTCIAQAAKDLASIDFPDGSSTTIHFQISPPQPPQPPVPKKLADSYQAFSPMIARGDAFLARRMAAWLTTCKRAHHDPAALEAAVTKLRAQRVITYGDGSHYAIDPSASIAEIERQQLRELYAFCVGITQAQLDTIAKLKVQAVKDNFWASMRESARIYGRTKEAVDEWTEAWEGGHRPALQYLALLYSQPDLNIPAELRPTPDPVRAYAYEYLHLRIAEALVGKGHVQVAELRQSLQGYAKALDAAQIRAAQLLAKDLLRKNTRCCYRE